MKLPTALCVLCMVLTSAAAADGLRDSLDASLATGDMQQLGAIMKGQTEPSKQQEIREWLKENVENGKAPAQIALVAALASLKTNQDDALLYLSYYRALIFIDGATCADRTAPASRLEATIFLFRKFTNDQSIPVDWKRDAVERAVKLEESTAPVRKVDPSLCDAGLGTYAGKSAGQPNDPVAQESRPGSQPATTLYANDAIWRAKRTEGLPKLKDMLFVLSGVGQ